MPNDWLEEVLDDEIAEKGFTVRLTDDEMEELDLIIAIRNEAIRLRGKKRRNWKKQTVMRKAFQLYADAWWETVHGGRPSTKEERARVAKEYLDALKAEASKQKKRGG